MYYTASYQDCKIIDVQGNQKVIQLDWGKSWGSKYDSYHDIYDPAFVNAPGENVQVGDKLKKRWQNSTYDVTVKSIHTGPMYKLHFTALADNSEFWIKPTDPKLCETLGGNGGGSG